MQVCVGLGCIYTSCVLLQQPLKVLDCITTAALHICIVAESSTGATSTELRNNYILRYILQVPASKKGRVVLQETTLLLIWNVDARKEHRLFCPATLIYRNNIANWFFFHAQCRLYSSFMKCINLQGILFRKLNKYHIFVSMSSLCILN